MTRRWSIVILGVAALLLTGCPCKEEKLELEECRSSLEDVEMDLAACETPAAFQLYIQKDAFGMFQPFTNQYRDEYRDVSLPQREFRDGFLVQLGVIEGTAHPWQYIQLNKSGSEVKVYGAADQPWWIDVECGTTTDEPLTPEMAAWLIPDPTDEETKYRMLHAMFTWTKPMTAVTMWAPPLDESDPGHGLTVETGRTLFTGAATDHGHVHFNFESKKDCSVRVWNDLTSNETFAAGEVDEIRVVQIDPNIHGGPHFPGWGKLTGGG